MAAAQHGFARDERDFSVPELRELPSGFFDCEAQNIRKIVDAVSCGGALRFQGL